MKCQELIENNMRYARNLALQYCRERVIGEADVDDLTGQAYVGLCEAAKRYDPGRGSSFTTFSYLRIKGKIVDYFRSGQYADPLLLHYGPSSDSDGLRNDVELVDSEEQQVKALERELEAEYRPAEDVMDLRKGMLRLHLMLRRLPESERTVLQYRYFEGLTFDEIGERMGGASKSWVSRVHTRGLRQLRKLFSGYEL